MRSTEVQLEDWAWAALETVARQQGVDVSDLIRFAVEEKYLRTALERVEAFRAWKAPWRDREDLGYTAEYVGQLRDDGRIDRLYSE